MFIGRVNRRRDQAFTLLEITLAVAILAMVAMAIYRFVAANLIAVRISTIENAAEARYTGFVNLINSQMQELSTQGGIMGDPYKFNDQSQDEVSWICSSGPGLLTRYATGEFIVTMKLKRSDISPERMDIGFLRKPRDTADGSTEGSTDGESWVPVLEDVRGLEVRYYDPRLPAWVDKWTDTNVMPRLVRLVIGLPDRKQPMEVVIALARTPLQIMLQQPQLLQTPTLPGVQAPGSPSTTGTQGPATGAAPPSNQPPPKK